MFFRTVHKTNIILLLVLGRHIKNLVCYTHTHTHIYMYITHTYIYIMKTEATKEANALENFGEMYSLSEPMWCLQSNSSIDLNSATPRFDFYCYKANKRNIWNKPMLEKENLKQTYPRKRKFETNRYQIQTWNKPMLQRTDLNQK